MTYAFPRVKFMDWLCEIVLGNYANGGKAIQLVDAEDGSPIARATVWVEGLEADEIAIKDWSENSGMYEVLRDARVITSAHRAIASGFVVAPVCHIHPDCICKEFKQP